MVAELGAGRLTGTIRKVALTVALAGALVLTGAVADGAAAGAAPAGAKASPGLLLDGGAGAGKPNVQDLAGDPSQWVAGDPSQWGGRQAKANVQDLSFT